MRSAALALLLIAAAAAIALAANPPCMLHTGARVILFGGVDDPDVLMWDARSRLVAYAGGSADTRSFLLPHAVLLRPGTRALVEMCAGAVVHPKFGLDAADAVGVLILSGSYRGRYGWVSSSDVRALGKTRSAPDGRRTGSISMP